MGYSLAHRSVLRESFLTAQSAELLARHGATLVGIDSLNIDDTNDRTRPLHTTLLGKGIPIVEHLCNLSQVVGKGARFFAPVLKIKSCGTFPVRAFAINGEPADLRIRSMLAVYIAEVAVRR